MTDLGAGETASTKMATYPFGKLRARSRRYKNLISRELGGARAGPRPGLYRGGRRTGLSDRVGPQRLRKTRHCRGLGVGGRGGMSVGEVLVDGIADGVAPSGGSKGVDVLVLGEMDGLGEGLGEIGEGAGGTGFDVATGDGGNDTAQGGAEIAGGEVFAGEIVRDFAGKFVGSAGLGFLAGMVEAKVGMIGGAGSAALAAIGKGETTQREAVLLTKRGHGYSPKVELEIKKPR
jgi:hypothetical protein